MQKYYVLIKIMGIADVSDDSAISVSVNKNNGNHLEIIDNIYQDSIICNFDEDIEDNQLTERELVIVINGEKIYPLSIASDELD